MPARIVEVAASENQRVKHLTFSHEEAKVLHHDTGALRPGLSSGEHPTLTPTRLRPSEHGGFVLEPLNCNSDF